MARHVLHHSSYYSRKMSILAVQGIYASCKFHRSSKPYDLLNRFDKQRTIDMISRFIVRSLDFKATDLRVVEEAKLKRKSELGNNQGVYRGCFSLFYKQDVNAGRVVNPRPTASYVLQRSLLTGFTLPRARD